MGGYARWTKAGPVSRVVVGITGASGAVYAVRLLEVLKGLGIGADIIISDAGIMVLRHEIGLGMEDQPGGGGTPQTRGASDACASAVTCPGGLAANAVLGTADAGAADAGAAAVREAVQAGLMARLDRVASVAAPEFAFHHIADLMSRVASGSSFPGPMVVVPCTMCTLAAIATGAGHNLIHRAADVALKEGIPLVLVPRETPLSLIHLRNLTAAAEAGARIVPAMPAFYGRPTSVAEMVDFVVGRILDAIGVEHRLYKAWAGED